MITATCHSVVADTSVEGAAVVALVGAPNVGKSSLFNALTGARATTGNWPGTSVDVARGGWGGRTVIDLPGAYSLDALSPDEQLTADLVSAADKPDVVVAIVDAAHVARSLYLVSQLRELPLHMVVAVSMSDVAEHHGISVDVEQMGAVIGVPTVLVHPRKPGPQRDLEDAVDAVLADCCDPKPRSVSLPADADDLAHDDERFAWIDAVVAASVTTAPAQRTWSDRIDRFVTAPVIGPLIFLGVMWVVFQLTTTVAAPMQDFLDNLISGPISTGAAWLLNQAHLGGGWFESFVVNGLVAGVGMVLTFIPLMAIMFALLALLEDSGYLARAAVVTDTLMRRIGLPGRAFLPLVVGFGCNVPAISATRILPQAKQRLLTALLAPFASCTARLTVYVLIATTFFGSWAGTVVFGMYVASIVVMILVGLLLRATLWRTMGADPLVLDLPPYQRPTLRLTSAVTWQRLKGFLQTATSIIVVTVCLVWLFQAIPGPRAAEDVKFGDVAVETSLYGEGAKAVAPVFKPTGFGAWETTSALIVGFLAKEAVLSSWAQTYAVEDPGDSGEPGQLGEKITESFDQASGGHALPAVLAFLVFLMAYTPCVATIAAQKREIGWKWTLFGIGMQMTVAYGLAVMIFQIGRLFL